MTILYEQLKFDSLLPKISGNIDYELCVAELEMMSEIIAEAGVDDDIAQFLIDRAQRRRDAFRAKKGLKPRSLLHSEKVLIAQNGRKLFRGMLLRKITRESLRVFCCNVAAMSIRQQFCQINGFVEAKIFSKSSLSEFENALPAEYLKKVHGKILIAASGQLAAGEEVNQLGFSTPISIEHCYADTTCMQANIHYPVDWLLLRDATRTSMLACDLIRNAGLRHRMPCEPKGFISQINSLCIQMAQCRRQKDSKKKRKKILRLMKKLLRKVAGHAERHAKLLDEYWPETKYGQVEAKEITDRIRNILSQLPAAIFQAHERIIGERRIKNSEKILSLYEDELHVIVRGKAGSETEFGNTLLLVEQADGLIVDFMLCREKSPGDPTLLINSLEYVDSIMPDKIKSVATDRGFDSPETRKLLDSKNIFNAICPRSIPAYIEKSKDPKFLDHQKRRAQTEGRIAITNGYTGNPQRQKSFGHRKIHLALSVLAHNIRKLAKLRLAQQLAPPAASAA